MVLNESQQRTGKAMRHWIRTSAWRFMMLMLGVLVFSGALSTSGIAFAQTQHPATITSDKSDYVPGQTVTLTGSGWKPGEVVSIVMAVDPMTHADIAITAVADQDGNFTDGSYTVQRSDLNVTFNVVAIGDKGSTAKTTFTDAATITMTIVGSGLVTSDGGTVGPPVDMDCGTGTTGACSVNFNGSTTVVLTATPAAGFIFTGWTTPTGPVYCTGTTNPCTINVPNGTTGANNDTMTATFTATSTTSAVTSSVNPSLSGQSVTFTSKIAPNAGATVPTGTVQFVVDGSNFGAAVAVSSCSPAPDACASSSATTTLTVGNHTVVGNYVSPNGQSKGEIYFQSEPANNDTLTIGATVYAFHTNTGQCAAAPQRCVARNATLTTQATNLANAIAGTCFNGACTVDPAVTSVANSLQGGSVTLTNTSAAAVTLTSSAPAVTSAAPSSISAPASTFGNSSGTLTGGQTVTTNPVPAISTLSPSSGVAGAAAQTLTINGSNFLSTSTATYNGVAHTVTFVSAAQLTIPLTAADQAAAGTFPVVVTNPAPGGGASNTVNFTITNAAPTITTLAPTSAIVGASAQTLTINGTGFSAASTVTYNAVAHAATFVSAAQLTISLSTGDLATVGSYPVVVTNPAPGGGVSNTVNFVVNNPVPTITTLSPSSATAGAAAQTLTINGTNFVASSTVTYNAVAHTATFVNSTQLTIPLTTGDQATAGTFPVVVTNPAPGGGSSSAVNFTVNNPAPTVTTLSPSSATAGASAQTLTINGTNFLATSTVTYNAVAHTATFVNNTQLTIPLTAPDQATAGNFAVVVTNPSPGGGSSTPVNFTVNNPVPAITTLSPSSASAGSAAQTLTINGSNFVTTSTATYNGTAHTVTFVSSAQVKIQLSLADQAVAGSYPVVVTNPAPGGGASNSVNFTITVGNTTTTLISGTNPSVTGQSVTFTATVAPIPTTGSVITFKNGATTLGTGTTNASGVATLAIALDAALSPYSVTASFPGDANFNASTSTALTQTVNKAATTTTVATGTLGTATVVGQAYPVAFTVAVTAPGGGTITGSDIITVSDGSATCTATITVGTCNLTSTSGGTKNITAVFPGDASYATSTSTAKTHTVGKANTTTAITTNLSTPTNVGQAYTVAFTVTPTAPGAGTPTGNVTVSDGSQTCTTTVAIGSCSVTSTTAGTKSVTAAYVGDTNFNASTSPGVSHQVNAAPVITSAATATFGIGAAGSFQVTATGTPAPTFSEVGALPTGVTFSAAGLLSGTPGAGTLGTYPIVITATNGVTPDATQSFTLTVGQAPAITSVNNATFVSGTPGSFQVTATGSPAPTFAVTAGTMPSGLSMSAAGLISGTPAGGQTQVITITASNGVTPNATQSFTVQVNQQPLIDDTTTSVAYAVGVPGTPFTFTLLLGTPSTATWTETGALPSGITLTTAGVLSGTPTQVGNFPIVVTADNGVAPAATESFTVSVGKGATYTQPFNTGHGWTYTQTACSQGIGGSCSNNAADTTAADCNPSPCVAASTSAGLGATSVTGYFHNTYTWMQLGVPSRATVIAVDGSFWDKSVTACQSGTSSGMQIFDSANTTEVTSVPLEVGFNAEPDTAGATHGNAGAKTVLPAFQPASTTVTLRFNLVGAVNSFQSCSLSGDNYNLTISYIPANSRQVIVASVMIDRYGRVLGSVPLIPDAKSKRSELATE